MVNVESGLKEDVCFLNKYALNSSSRRAVGFFLSWSVTTTACLIEGVVEYYSHES